MNEDILDENHIEGTSPYKRRRDLLPTWIKFFTWIFLLFGLLVPVVIGYALFGTNLNLALYGLATYQPLSLMGIIITLLFAFKAIVAIGLWTEKDWGPNLATYDAIIGILVCVFVMLIMPFLTIDNGFSFNFRLEIIPLYYYYQKMREIESNWANLGMRN